MIKLKPETEQALARARGDLAAYCKAMWPPFECAPHHRAIIDRLQALALGSIDRLMIFLPPRHGKSVITSTLFPAWFLGRNPGASVISASYGAELSLDFGRRVRGFVDHDLHRTIFPECRPLDDNLAAHRFGLTKGGTYFGVGVGGPITGRGADLFIIDDPIKSAEEAYSGVSRASLKQWYEQVAYTRLQPGGRIVLIQTRWHQDDLAGWLLKEHANDNWIVLSLPAFAEPNDVLYRPEGAPLWPSHFSSEELSRIRMAIGSNAWSALYQQRPVAAEGAVFRRDWFHPYVDIPEVYRIIFSLDTAFKTHESSDYSVLEVWGENKTGYYLLDVVRERLDFPALQARAIAKAQFWHPHAVLIEDAASGQSLVQILKVESRLPILPVKPLGDKTARASAVSPLFESGRIFVPQQAHWLADYLDEMTTFPASAHDDQVDASSQALAWLHEHAQISYTGYQSVNGPLGPGEAAIHGERAREWEEDNPGAGGTWNVIAGNARRDFGKGTW